MNPCAVLIPIPYDPSMPPPERVTQQRKYARIALREAAIRCGAPVDGWQQDPQGRPLPRRVRRKTFSEVPHNGNSLEGCTAPELVGLTAAATRVFAEPRASARADSDPSNSAQSPEDTTRLDGNTEFHWSLSHTKRWAAAIIADGPVGIDIERITPRRLTTMEAIADKAEWHIVGNRTWPNFFRIWTAKEATLKANGVGIGHLIDCRVVDSRETGSAGDASADEPRASARADSHALVMSSPGAGNGSLTLEYNGTRFPVEHFLHDGHIAAILCTSGPVTWHVVAAEQCHASTA